MSLKKPRLVLLVLITYHSLFGLPILDGETLETTASMDGTERLTTGIVIQGSDYSLGASYRFVPEYPNDFMLGLNTSLVSLGHLSDAGLASEVRNPGADALGRLSERTFYRSDVRSVSRSRIGIAVMPWDGRAGVSWERRENLNAGILWAVPVKTELFELEILGEAAHLMESEVDEGWYPDRDGTPAGSLGIAALRWRFDFEKYVLGMSSIVSAGSGFRPGMLCSLSMESLKDHGEFVPDRYTPRRIFEVPKEIGPNAVSNRQWIGGAGRLMASDSGLTITQVRIAVFRPGINLRMKAVSLLAGNSNSCSSTPPPIGIESHRRRHWKKTHESSKDAPFPCVCSVRTDTS
jgi:hypothetical protein